ncbi:S-adenosyl-L-methionine-dependent methyltransferase [Aspergillus minisclerotigenes]|uniref:S-adenosyl-L-methionine-dependent methyltransferase n=1 Tax=Aspergillus minisclerotigenes TaxID=656917 RepID=A0A5N6IV91_9EURO|nr:S-adenosyl-L-methionine-dependent methyltransferase [Aspergillus minisclerotigenes]
MESLIAKIQQKAASANYVERKKLLDTLRDLQYSIETPEDAMQRVIHMNLHFAAIRTALDLNLFNDILDNAEPSTVNHLAAKHSADPLLLGKYRNSSSVHSAHCAPEILTRKTGRILRYLASLGVLKEAGRDTFTSTRYTSNLARPEIQAGLYVYFDMCNPTYQEMPRYLAETGYQNPTSFTDGIFQRAHKTDLHTFAFVHGDPVRSAHFNHFMKAQRGSQPKCFDLYPFDEESKGWPSDKPLFVDVGGGAGYQTVSFLKRFPNLPGRVVLQDLPEPIEDAKSVVPTNVERMAHNFFEPQPVIGAKYYYLRMILHDHTDENSIKILSNLVPALGEDSLILLDEMVLPSQRVDEASTQHDLTMMTFHSSMERSEEQWAKLVGAVGLKIKKVVPYAPGYNLGVVVCGL